MKDTLQAAHDTYVPCRFEFELLARAWWREFLDVHFFCYCGERWSDPELVEIGIIIERLRQLQKILGEIRFEEIRIETERRFSMEIEPNTWRDFNSTRTA